MAWQKSPPELVALFDAVMPGPPVQRRLMFGYPAGFVNGRLAFGLFEDKLVLRLPPFQLDALLRSGGSPFTPMPGRTMPGFAVMPSSLLVDGPGLRGWIETAVQHAQSLPPKGGEPESESDLPAAPAAPKPKAKAKPKRAATAPKPKAKAKPKRAAAAKQAAKKPARKVVKKAAKKPVRKAAKLPVKKAGKKAKSAATRKAGKAKRSAAKAKRPVAKRGPVRRAAKRR